MYSVSSVVTESEDASIALAALADAFGTNKSVLAKAMKDAIKDALEESDSK